MAESSPKRPKLGFCDLSHFPQRLKKDDIEERKPSRRSCVLTVSRDNNHARSYVHGGSGFETTRKWLDSLANSWTSDSAGHTPLIINGMTKTGKTAWIREILPTMIRENPTFGDASSRPAAIMEVDCATQLSHSSPYAFLRDLFVTFVALLARNVDVDISDLYAVLPPDGDAEGFKSRFGLAFRRISHFLAGRHVFFLLDEIQAWFTWYESDKRNVDVAAVDSMRQVLKSFLINDFAPFCHFAVTGSCMAEAWLNIVYCPPNGRPVKTSACVNLPARVSRRAFTKAIEIIAERYAHVDKASIDGCARMADRNPALLSHLVYEISCCTSDERKNVERFCQEIVSRIGDALWRDVAASFFLMPRVERELLHNLVHRHIGISREVFRGLCAGAWHYHLSPFCKTDSEDFVHLPSRPFRAFVEQVIGKRGELLIRPGTTTIGILPLHLLLPSFSKLVLSFGEWCRLSPIRNGLAWFETALRRVFESLEDFKGHDFVLLILCHPKVCEGHKEEITSSKSFSDTSYAIFKALRHIFGHEISCDDKSAIATSFPVSLDEAYDHLC